MPSMVTFAGPLATIDCGPSQARKGAAATMDSGAGVWLAEVTTQFFLSEYFLFVQISKLIYLCQVAIMLSLFRCSQSNASKFINTNV